MEHKTSDHRKASTLSLEAWRRRVGEWHQSTRDPGLSALLVVQAALIFIVVPLTAMGLLAPSVLPAMFVLLVIVILFVTWHSQTAAIAVTVAVALSALGTLLWKKDPTPLTEWLSGGGRLLAVVALSLVIARVVFAGGKVTLHRVQGAVVLYLNFGLAFFSMYRLIDVLSPGAFAGLPTQGKEFGSGATLLYFSFTTLTTLGYGDIAPLHPLARSLATLEAAIGALYPATLLARLVSLEIAHRGPSDGG